MTRSNVVIPNPRIPSSLGTLNVVFGLLLIFSSLANVGWTIMIDRLQAAARAERTPRLEARLAELRAQQKTETNAQERARLQSEIDRLEDEKDDGEDDPIVLGGTNTSDVRLAVPFWTNHALGVSLNGLMVASGVGLIALRPWGRSLALGVAALKLVKLVVLTLVTVFVTVPIQVTRTRAMWAKIEARRPAGTPRLSSMSNDMARMTAVYTTVSAVGFGIAGMVYPALTLWLLNKPSARAALIAVGERTKLRKPAGTTNDLLQ